MAFMEPNTQNINEVLKKLLEAIPEVKAAAIISRSGFIIASTFSQGVYEMGVGGMTVAFFYLAERVVMEMRKGEFDQILVKGTEGYIIVTQAGFDALLITSLSDIRGIFFDVNGICKKIAQLLG